MFSLILDTMLNIILCMLGLIGILLLFALLILTILLSIYTITQVVVGVLKKDDNDEYQHKKPNT